MAEAGILLAGASWGVQLLFFFRHSATLCPTARQNSQRSFFGPVGGPIAQILREAARFLKTDFVFL